MGNEDSNNAAMLEPTFLTARDAVGIEGINELKLEDEFDRCPGEGCAKDNNADNKVHNHDSSSDEQVYADKQVNEEPKLMLETKDILEMKTELDNDQLQEKTIKEESKLMSKSNDILSMQTELDNDGLQVAAGLITENEFPTLDFPVTINIHDLNPNDEASFLGIDKHALACDSVSYNPSTTSTVKKRGTGKLTQKEEERIAEILRQEDDSMENYILPCAEEGELDILLGNLGYSFLEEKEQKSTKERGDPVLRELAEQRSLEERERIIDRALRALLKEPLPRVIRFLDAVNDDVSSLGNSVLTAPVSEERITQLVQEVLLELQRDNMTLVDGDTVHSLAASILENELTTSSLAWHLD